MKLNDHVFHIDQNNCFPDFSPIARTFPQRQQEAQQVLFPSQLAGAKNFPLLSEITKEKQQILTSELLELKNF